jgi:Tol biopolymer transport system component
MNIWRVAIDEGSGDPRGEPEAITTPASFAAHLSVSADGRSLAYTAVLETQNIEKLRLDPGKGEVIGDPMPVTTGSRFWANPDPSPDGGQVVFYSQVGPEGDLYVTRADGTRGLRQLTDDRPIDRVPRWSPGGERIAMFSDRSGELHVWSISADGSELRQLTRRSASVVAWSPDGRRLAVTGGTGAPNASTSAIIDAGLPSENNVIAELPPIPRSSFRFVPNSWSPDGQWIAGQNGYTTLGVLVYSVATNTYERVLDFGEWPVWLPDSRHILFVSRGREFHLLDTRTRTNRVIYSSPRDTLGPPRLSRDGRVAFFSRRVTEADVWTSRLSF